MNGLRKIQLNCRKATYLIDKRDMSKLTFRESIELRIHLAGCGVCRTYVKQSARINEMIKTLLTTSGGFAVKLNDSYKLQLTVQINDRLNKN